MKRQFYSDTYVPWNIDSIGRQPHHRRGLYTPLNQVLVKPCVNGHPRLLYWAVHFVPWNMSATEAQKQTIKTQETTYNNLFYQNAQLAIVGHSSVYYKLVLEKHHWYYKDSTMKAPDCLTISHDSYNS